MTDLILIRHGETEWNRQLRFQGQVDVALNEVGLEQARRLAQRLEGEAAQGVYSSDLQRARQTAEPVGHTLALPPQWQSGLREQSFGEVDGLSVQEIQAAYPQAWAQWQRFQQDHAMPGGESARQFHARVMQALRGIATAHPQQTLVVVTHGGVLDMVYRTARSLGLDGPRQCDIPNAGLNRVRLLPSGGIEIVQWADVAHLDGLPPQPVYDQKKLFVADPSPSAL